MALIKCKECGKEISDKAKVCVNCGCPINVIEKEEIKEQKVSKKKDDKVILVSKRDKSLNFFKNLYPKVLGAIIVVAIVVIVGMENSLSTYSNSRGNATLFGFLLVILPCIILLVICNIMYNNAKKTNITLTNKELFGVVYKVGSVSSITFPLDKISSINTIKLFGLIDGIMIIPFNGVPQKIFFIDNGEEFRQTLLIEINK